MAVESGSFNVMGFLLQVVFWLGVALTILVVAGMSFLIGNIILKQAKYKYMVPIFEEVEEGHYPTGRFDRAREVFEKGQSYLELMKTKDADRNPVRIPFPGQKQITAFKSFPGYKMYVHVGQYMGNQYVPMAKQTESPVSFHSQLQDLSRAFQLRMQAFNRALDNYQKKESFWERHQQIILFSTAMIIMVVMMFVLIWQMQDLNVVVNQQIR